MITRDSERHLAQALDSCRPYAEVVMLDNGSVDRTFEIAARYPYVRVERYQGAEWPGIGPLLRMAADLAHHDWLLCLDSDEEITPELAAAIAAEKLDPACVYVFRRVNLLNGQAVRHSGWSDDRIVRLFHRSAGGYTDARVHPCIAAPGARQILLAGTLRHYSYDNVDDFMRKAIWFADRFTEQYRGKKTASVPKAVAHSMAAFFKLYLLRGGILDGYAGFLIAISNAYATLYKYLKLREANRRKP
jgi:glycosyltransferase involved in cell wall biosynthesis